MTQPRLLARPNRNNPARPEFDGLSFVHFFDKATLPLGLSLLTGRPIKSGKLTITREGDFPIAYVTLELAEILVAAIEVEGTSDAGLLESVTFNFQSFEFKYFTQNSDGSVEPSGELPWNVPSSKDIFP